MIKLRPKIIEYQEAFDKFVECRKEVNEALEKGNISEVFDKLVKKANENDAITMDVLAYYYKSGIANFLKEDYQRFYFWELLACSKGNNFAIEKMQFIFNNTYEEIFDDENFDEIIYKNDITEENVIYVLGKEIAKVMVRKYKIYAEMLSTKQENGNPFSNEMLLQFKKDLENALPDIIEKLK